MLKYLSLDKSKSHHRRHNSLQQLTPIIYSDMKLKHEKVSDSNLMIKGGRKKLIDL